MTYDDPYHQATNRLGSGNTTFANYSYGYDAVGNVRTISDLTSAAYDRTFEYDDLGRLIVANGGSSLWGSGGYSYDAMGNMLTASLGTARNATFSYDGTTPKIALAADNGNVVAPQYDGAGNELTGTSDTIGRRETRVYSARNLLARIDAEQSGRSERYTFDGRGVRVLWKEFTGSTQTASRSYVYSPELNLLSQKDATAAALDILWFAGAPIAQQQGTGTLRFTFTDHLGTPLLQTDNAKRPAALWRAEYEPYGNIFALRAGTRTDQPLRFPGQEYAWTSASGAEENYNIFRWYRSGWGRYTQVDPAGLAAAFTPYAYAKGRTTVAADPLGLYVIIVNPVSVTWGDTTDDLPCLGKPACTQINDAWMQCNCRCSNDEGYSMDVVASISPAMFFRSRDQFDRRNHENLHVADVRAAIADHLEDLEGQRFQEKTDCDAKCLAAMATFPAKVRRWGGRIPRETKMMNCRSRQAFLLAAFLLFGAHCSSATVPTRELRCTQELDKVARHVANNGYMPLYLQPLLRVLEAADGELAERPYAESLPYLRFSGDYVWKRAGCSLEISPRRDLPDGRTEVLRLRFLVHGSRDEVTAAIQQLLRAVRQPELSSDILRKTPTVREDLLYDSEREIHVGFRTYIIRSSRGWQGALELTRGGSVMLTSEQ